MAKRTKYPWTKWFSKKSFKLTRGKHFESQPYCMAQSIRNRAVLERKSVSIKIGENSIHVKIVGDLK